MFDAGKISQAVTDCLDSCYASSAPLSAFAGFLSQLSADPNWSAYEIEAVEIRALRVLSRIVSESGNREHEGTSISVVVNRQDFPERPSLPEQQPQTPSPLPDP
jgi:hypothetical protein